MAPATATAPVMPDMGIFQVVDLSRIDFSKTNPRKTYDKQRLDELAQSIREKGVIEAVVLRPKGDRYELVAGERRTRAAKLAGLAGIKAEIRDLSDEDVLELQVIENLQRDEIHPLDEADGYRALMAMNPEKHTPEHVAAAVGKSVSYIYQRLKLLALIGKAQKLFRDGALGAAHAIQLARLQPPDQGRVLEEMWAYGDNVSLGQLRSWIERNVLLDLKKAVFDPTDPNLVPAAGACVNCPKRTGCTPALFDDIKSGDTCTDRICFQTKETAALEAKLHALDAKHGEGNVALIVTEWTSGNEEKALRQRWPGVLMRNEVRFAGKDKCEHTRAALIVRGDRSTDGRTGDIKQVCTAAKTCKVHRERFDSSRGLTVDAAQREKDRKHRHAQRVWVAAKSMVLAAALQKIRTTPACIFEAATLRMVAARLFRETPYDAQKEIVRLAEWDVKAWQKGAHGSMGRFASRGGYAEQQIAAMDLAEVSAFLIIAALAAEVSAPTHYDKNKKSDGLDALCKRLKVDAAGLEKKVRASMPLPGKPKTAKKTAPAKAAKKAKAKK